MYKNKLINKVKLKKYLIIYCGAVKKVFKVNYMFLSFLYRGGLFSEVNILTNVLKKMLPILNSLAVSGGKVAFASTRHIYSKSIFSFNRKISTVKHLLYRIGGLYYNFSKTRLKIFSKIDFKERPSLFVFFYLRKKDLVLLETKAVNIPVVALVSGNKNSALIDYPLLANSEYFYSIYFFSKFLFRLICLNVFNS